MMRNTRRSRQHCRCLHTSRLLHHVQSATINRTLVLGLVQAIDGPDLGQFCMASPGRSHEGRLMWRLPAGCRGFHRLGLWQLGISVEEFDPGVSGGRDPLRHILGQPRNWHCPVHSQVGHLQTLQVLLLLLLSIPLLCATVPSTLSSVMESLMR